MFNITSKYFTIFSNKSSIIWVMNIKTDFLSCYSCLRHIYFHVIPSSLILPVIKNRGGWGWGAFLLNRQNLLSKDRSYLLMVPKWFLSNFLSIYNLDMFYFMMSWLTKEDGYSQKLFKPLICFKIMLPYVLNHIGNKIMRLTSTFGTSLS